MNKHVIALVGLFICFANNGMVSKICKPLTTHQLSAVVRIDKALQQVNNPKSFLYALGTIRKNFNDCGYRQTLVTQTPSRSFLDHLHQTARFGALVLHTNDDFRLVQEYLFQESIEKPTRQYLGAIVAAATVRSDDHLKFYNFLQKRERNKTLMGGLEAQFKRLETEKQTVHENSAFGSILTGVLLGEGKFFEAGVVNALDETTKEVDVDVWHTYSQGTRPLYFYFVTQQLCNKFRHTSTSLEEAQLRFKEALKGIQPGSRIYMPLKPNKSFLKALIDAAFLSACYDIELGKNPVEIQQFTGPLYQWCHETLSPDMLLLPTRPIGLPGGEKRVCETPQEYTEFLINQVDKPYHGLLAQALLGKPKALLIQP